MANCCSTERKAEELSNISPTTNPTTPLEPPDNRIAMMQKPSILVNQSKVVQTPVPEYEDELFLKYIDFKRKWLKKQSRQMQII